MTDHEALTKAQNELDTSSYLAEVTLNKGLQKVHQNRIAWLARVLRLARKALYDQEARKNQRPLSIEELRQMNGEPVWVQPPRMPEFGRWAIVAGVDTTDGEKTLYLHADFTCREYGRVWLAYRYKPNGD